MTKSLFKMFSLLTILALVLMSLPMRSASAAGTISLTTIGNASTENFDTLSNVAGSTTNNLTINGWYLTESGGGARDNEQYAVDTGGSTTGDTYSYGPAAATDRALGALRSGTLIPIFGANFANNTGSTITSLDVAYIGEEWRLGAAARTDQINFEYSTNATDLVTGTWTGVGSLNFVTPNTVTVGAKDGNAAGNRTNISATVSGLNIANGATFWIRWTDTDPSGSDDGLAVDDFSITPQSVVLPNLTIDDVSMNEGNAGPTSFNFTVNLSAPAGPGGVTFDIATQDNSATVADNDYQTNSLTGQTIAAGNSSYSFTVLVNGDMTDEPNETFFVNVTAVSGATLGDGQGVGTIQNDDAPPPPPAGNVVISQVYGGGGNAGATYTNDFIELYNRTANPISLTGWSVQYASATGAAWAVTNLSGSIAPGKYYLVQEAAGAGGTTPLPTPDATGSIPMSATAGKVALVNNSTMLSGTCPTGSNISDFVGYGTTANCFEGTGPTAAPSNTTAVLRLGNGATDTDNNAADFVTGAPNPRNSVDPAPYVFSTTPTNGAAGVALNANIAINFSEPVNVTGAWYTISCATSGPHLAAVTGGPISFTLDPDSGFASNELCTVTITAAQVSDQDTDDPPDTMTGDYVFSFTTLEVLVCGDPATAIHTIQGSGPQSPMNGATNVVIEGIVVGDYQNTTTEFSGFYVQEEDADADADMTTSEGIFVFDNGFGVNVQLGDKVRVRGNVFEFETSGGSGAFLTELRNVNNVTLCNTGNSVTATTVSLPVTSLTDWERYEGMLISISSDLTVTETFTLGRFGEVSLSVNGRLPNPTNVALPGAPAIAQEDLNDRSRIVLDDGNGQQNIDPTIYPTGGLSASNTLRSGYTVHGLTGVLEQRFSVYRIQPVGAISFDAITNPRTAAPANVGGGTLKVASFNVLNYFNGDGLGGGFPTPRGANTAFEFSRQRAKIISAITTMNADIIGLMEMENDAPPNSALEDLVSGLNAATAPGTYAFINTGIVGTDAIRVALIYKPAVVTPVGAYAIIDSSVDPRFLDTKNRPSLAQTFQQISTGEKVTVVVNHLKSKGSDCNDVGDPDTGDGQGNCNVTRTQAVEALTDWLATDPTGSGDPDFLIIGDMNSYALEDPIMAFEDAGYSNLIASYIGEHPYSFVFDGESGYLDHALASPSLVSQATGVTEWHINADEPTVLDYNVEFKTANQVNTFYNPGPYRASDHDPVVAGLNLDATAPDTTIDSNPPNPSSSTSATFTFSGTDSGTGVASFECKLDGASFSACTSPQSYNSLADSNHTFQVRAIDNLGNIDATPASFTWVIDTTAPDTTIDSNPSNPSNSSNASFSFSGTDSGTGVASFECKLDGGSFAACTSPKNYSSLSDSSHTFQVRAIDGVGNVDQTPASFTWIIDTVAPSVTINQASGQADPTINSPINFTVVFSESVTGFTSGDVTLSGTAGATTVVVTGPGPTYNVAVSGMTNDGTVIASIPAGSATDAAGNGNSASTSTDNTVTYNFNVAPTATVTNGQCSATNMASGTINLTLFDADGDPLTLILASNSNTTLVPSANIVIGGSGYNRTITVTAAAKKSGTATLTFNLSDGTVTVPVVITVKVGTDKNETLNGTAGIDMIFGLGGKNTINGLGGNDLLCGGNGIDTINGGDGNDILDGSNGNDVLNGGNNDDILRGNSGDDSLTGGTGADSFSGGSGADTNTDFNAGQGDTSDGT